MCYQNRTTSFAIDSDCRPIDLTRLKTLTGATDGNLGAHLDHLARAGYVQMTKAFVGRRPAPRSKPARKGARRSLAMCLPEVDH